MVEKQDVMTQLDEVEDPELGTLYRRIGAWCMMFAFEQQRRSAPC